MRVMEDDSLHEGIRGTTNSDSMDRRRTGGVVNVFKIWGFDNFTRNERDWVHRPYSGELATASL